jgi:hypothetical protein
MKNIIVSFIIVLTVSSQPQFTTLYSLEYRQLPFERRLDNSGIYAIASFDIVDTILYINSYDSPSIFAYRNGTFHAIRETVSPGSDFVVTPTSKGEKVLRADMLRTSIRDHITLRRSHRSEGAVLTQTDGILSSSDGLRVTVTVPDRSTLTIAVHDRDVHGLHQLRFPGTLGYAECIGMDEAMNMYLLVETFVREVPLSVDRFIYVLDSGGSIVSILKVPVGNQLTLVKEFIIGKNGDLYHLFDTGSNVHIVQWSGLHHRCIDTLYYPPEYYEINHPNKILPIDESQSQFPGTPLTTSSRSLALRIGEQYVLYSYRVTAANLAPNSISAPDGDVVTTPSWLTVGWNAHIPYKWGGFSTLQQFSAGLLNGAYAGDINTESASIFAVGVDCSGFVSRCWQLSSHYSTAMMPNICTQYAQWDEMKPGDAVHKVGHVRLFVERTPNGGIKVVESAGRHWDVSYYTYSISGLIDYGPYYLRSMQSDFANERPLLKSVTAVSDTSVLIRWTSDTSGIKGYRLYTSPDGNTWHLHSNENVLTSDSTILPFCDTTLFFRVSRVLNNADASESNWSNVLGASLRMGAPTVTIVDAFENEQGSWEGPGHPFVIRYGRALAKISQSFESVRISEILSGKISLKDRPIVFWFTGDESTESQGAAVSPDEQSQMSAYLSGGGSLFINGSEIGYDLWEKGSPADKLFFTGFLKAAYKSDNAMVQTASGVEGSVFAGQTFRFGQNYIEDYPDVIDPADGSIACLKYSNGKGAGIQFQGIFGVSSIPAKLIYIGFPVETIADDSCFNALIGSVVWYFLPGCPVASEAGTPDGYSLHQNYPNPFNPSTTIRYALPKSVKVKLSVYDMLGREISVLVNEEQPAGWKEAIWNVHGIASGMYVYRLTAGEFTQSRKMLLMK